MTIPLEREYRHMLSTLDEPDRLHFQELEGVLDAHYVDAAEKWDILHEMMTHFYETEHTSFTEMFGSDPKSYALDLASSTGRSPGGFWRDYKLMLGYYTFIYFLCVIIVGRLAFSWLLIAVPFLVLLMVPLMNRSIKQQAFRGPAKQTVTTILFIVLFAGTKLYIIFSLHDRFDQFFLFNHESSIFTILRVMIMIAVIFVGIKIFQYSKGLFQKAFASVLILYAINSILQTLEVIWPGHTIFNEIIDIATIVTVIAFAIHELKNENRFWNRKNIDSDASRIQ
ncbi:hypothetical protein J4760_05775 [Salinicoccus sp. ID82-1]|uniref:DUF1129 domain-containing protein n=1 Tax=Salinicoccus cyprini TaxID=2493691 RepID=A0A558ART9_9STAP|nr:MULTISPECIES: hypothetical protein [Salinicoccus]MCG1009523.1 hypothetical protein [Salinicoccus sp. ID82-1]TVT26958.1 hypothetical protein FO441_10685 [Salinicoccus cyprini]